MSFLNISQFITTKSIYYWNNSQHFEIKNQGYKGLNQSDEQIKKTECVLEKIIKITI